MNKKLGSFSVVTLLVISMSLGFLGIAPTVPAAGAGNYLLDYITSIDSGGTYGDIYYNGTHIFAARGTSGVSVYTFDGSSFTLVDTNATTAKNYQSVWAVGSYVYAGTAADGLHAFTFDGTDLVYVTKNTTGGVDIEGVFANETYVFGSSDNIGLESYTFDGTDLTFIDDDGTKGKGCHGDDSYIFNAGEATNIAVYTFDGSTFTQVDMESAELGDTLHIYWDGTNAFESVGADGLRAWTFDGSSLTKVATVDDGNYWQSWDAGDGLVYVAGGSDSAMLYSFTGSAFTLEDTSNPLGYGSFSGVTGGDDYVFFSGEGNGIFAYNRTDVPSAPTNSNPDPAHEATGENLNPTLCINVSDEEGNTMNVTFRTNATGSWGDIGTNSTVGNGTYCQTNSSFNSYSTKYWWNVSTQDSDGNWDNDTYFFTTAGNSAPTQTNENPANGATGQELAFTWNVTVNDADGDLLNVTIQCVKAAAGGSTWNDHAANSSFQVSISGCAYSTKYFVYVNATDPAGSDGWSRETYNFTTKANTAPVNSDPTPANTATGISLNPTLYINVSDANGETMDVHWWTNATGSWVNFHNDNGVANSTQNAPTSNMNTLDTKYWWNVSTDDGNGGWDNDTYYFTTTDTFVWSGWSEGWDISSSHSCSSTGYLYGNWTKSEHVTGGTLDEEWTYSNDSKWTVSDESSWWNGNHTINISMTGGTKLLEFAVCNNSGTNRSQEVGWIHTTYGSPTTFYWIVIFAYNTAQDFDFLFSSGYHYYLAHWNGTNVTDIYTGLDFDNLNSWQTVEDVVWEAFPTETEGCYWKLIYNEHNGSIKFKHWSPLMTEPTGWEVQVSHANITHSTYRCHGFGTINWNDATYNTHFDLYNLWQLNYTVNSSAYCNISGYNESRPHMDFPVIDLGTWTEEIMSYFNASAEGNVSVDDVRSLMKDNITNPMNMESRMFELASPTSGQQNDTVYYYSCIMDNFTAFDAEAEYDEWLHLHVQMCPEQKIDTGENADIIVAIDVDNDHTWDANDRIYWAYADSAYNVWNITYNGNGDSIPVVYDAHIWQSDTSAPGNLHRYNSHLNYVLNIPLADLVTDDGVPLNVSDIFGLSIMTTTAGTAAFEYPCMWQNWNETSESPFWDEDQMYSNAINYFLNGSGEGCEQPNSTSIGRWGEGEITGTMDASGTLSYSMSINASFNDTSSTASEDYVNVNLSIYVNNTGTGNLNDIYLNMTWWNCSCSDLDMTFVSSNQDISNFTWYNDSCYFILRNVSNEPLTQASSWHIWMIINITNCSGVGIATGTVNITGNATELAEDVTVSGDDAPTFYWGISTTHIRITAQRDINILDTWLTIISAVGLVVILLLLFAVINTARRRKE